MTPTISDMTELYAYRYADDMDFTVARSKGAPVTGWLHAGGGPPWPVVVSESVELLGTLRVPHTTVEVYDGDEPTIRFEDWHVGMNRIRTLAEVDDKAAAALDAIEAGDAERAHDEADKILLGLVSPKVAAAYERLVERAPWWASA